MIFRSAFVGGRLFSGLGVLLALFLGAPAYSQDAPVEGESVTPEQAKAAFMAEVEKLDWVKDGGTGRLGSWAEITVPPGFRFTGPEGAQAMNEIYGNLPSPGDVGFFSPEDLSWSVYFVFEETGYVKDDEKDSIDSGKLLAAKKENQKAANVQREQMGLETFNLLGWAKEPFYNEDTNNLEWAIILSDNAGNEWVNYDSRILGRRGVMSAILVCGKDELGTILPQFYSALEGFSYVQGQTYAEYKKGDKVAKYGLTALVVGGGLAVAAKTGLLAVVFKFFGKAWYLVVAAFVGIGSWVKKMLGGRQQY